MLALDGALSKLATLDPRAAQVVELRFFGGLEENQVAEVLGVSAITVKRDWKAARAWLAGHEPLITTEVWDRVQRILDERKEHQTKGVRREFPFTGLISCGHCGLRLVAELKKGRYVYYHCTGHRGKCPEPYTRQESLVNEFAGTLGELVVPQEVLDWLAQEVTNTDQTQQAARATTIKRCEAELARLQHRLDTLYEDRLDGRIPKTVYDEKSRTISEQIAEVERKLTAARSAELPPLTTALDILRLTSNACHAFRAQPEPEQRKLLTMMLKEAQWKENLTVPQRDV
jgi:hypothetical protein